MNTQTIYEEYKKQKSIENTIPEKMPYTFKDILSCKDISEEDVKKDWKNLCKFDALTNQSKFCGNPIIYKYQLQNLLKCKRGTKGYKTLEEWFSDDTLKEELWKLAVKINRRKTALYPSPTDVYECHRKCKGSIVAFKASTAKYIYKRFGAKNVLDPTAGWGGRMLGAMSLGIDYTGIDTNINMKEAYINMMKVDEAWEVSTNHQLVSWRKETETEVTTGIYMPRIITGDSHRHHMRMIWDSCFNVDFSGFGYDLVLTSPPLSG